MIPFKSNVLNSQIYKEIISGSLGLGGGGKWGGGGKRGGWQMIAKGYEISFGSNENALKL